jgi:hypothetical protein
MCEKTPISRMPAAQIFIIRGAGICENPRAKIFHEESKPKMLLAVFNPRQ